MRFPAGPALALCMTVALAACGSSGLRLAGLTSDELYTLAMQKMAEEEWDDAISALEAFSFQFPTHPRYHEARYALGQAHFEKEEFITAAAEFGRLASDYPNAELADDARFRVCESYMMLSPVPQLDQEYTRSAIEHCESLVAYYPDSEHAERARQIVADMQNKLAMKLFQEGDYYYRRRAYDSAILSFNDILENYPTTGVVPRTLLQLVRTYENLGYADEAQAHRERLLRDFPESEEARQLRGSNAAEQR